MINYETILSSYDDKLTLMQWLKKVEAALKDASATGFHVNKRGNATITFSIDFENGDTLESEPLVLQQGESVTGAHMDAGHLILTLSNGDELDAGNLGAISGVFIDASQHLIVAYQDGTTQDLGAIFQGNVNISGTFNATTITGDSIIENMSGYSANLLTEPNWTFEKVYVGCVKNGNKLTLVAAVNMTKEDASAGNSPSILTLNLPSAVGNKLFPVSIGAYLYLDNKVVNAFKGTSDYLPIPSYIQKLSNTQLKLACGYNAASSMEVGQKYYFRYEATFLLSDSL